MGKSIMDGHIEMVNELRERGEFDIFNPTAKSFMDLGRHPNVYVKGRPFPSEDFISGHAFREKDDSISILHDHFAYFYQGFSIDQLGLCDPVVWYENFNLLHDHKAQPRSERCPCCGAKRAGC